MRLLRIHQREAEPYDLDVVELADAIESEADTIASDAGSDLLDDPGEEARAELRERVQREALRALEAKGEYRDPTGVRWTLEQED